MGASSLLFSCYQSLDKVLINEIWGSEYVAELIICLQWSFGIATAVGQPLVTALYPKILQAPFFFKSITKSGFIIPLSLIATATFVFLSASVATYFLPIEYSQISRFIWVGLLAGILFIIGQIISINFSKVGQEFDHIKSTFIPILVSIPHLYFLIIFYGVGGAMTSLLIFTVLYLLVCLIIFKRKNYEHR
jgi:O-antigen/teichoic acid export membrane protein